MRARNRADLRIKGALESRIEEQHEPVITLQVDAVRFRFPERKVAIRPVLEAPIRLVAAAELAALDAALQIRLGVVACFAVIFP